jgi:hypothetical protein
MNPKDKQKNQRLYKTYGLTLEGFNSRLEAQGGGCWICKKKDGRLCVDHIHIAGYKKLEPTEKIKYVRGILCFYCNTALKVFERTKDGIRNRELLKGVSEYFDTFRLKGED